MEGGFHQRVTTTTELCSGYSGFGAEPSNKLLCNSARIALLAAPILSCLFHHHVDHPLRRQSYFGSFSSLLLSSGLFHCCLWQETLFGSLPVLSALPSEEEDLRGLDRLGNVTLIVKVRFAGNASEW